MKVEFPLTALQRMQIMNAETLTVDLSNHPSVTELKVSAVEARLHIAVLHMAIKSGDQKTAMVLVNDWEDSQCL